MELNEIWQDARSLRPFLTLFFSGRLINQDGCLGLWLAETFPTLSLQPLKGIWWNLTRSKNSISSTKFVFFGPIWIITMAALTSDWLIHFRQFLSNCWTEFDETWQAASNQCPLPIEKQRQPSWPICQEKWHIVLRCTMYGPLDPLFVCSNVKYKRTDTLSLCHQQYSTTVDIHGPLQTRGKTNDKLQSTN